MPLAVTAGEFAAAMARLGPFEPAPRVAVGVSGGPDSMALALLASEWAAARGGSMLALIVDHRLRAESAAEASEAAARLAGRGIASRLLPLTGLHRGPALAERARTARFAALARSCADCGILHLLLGHHAADQAETVLIRRLGGSAAHGLAAMAPLVETASLRLLRPLLDVPPVRLRATLEAAGVGWVNDPSNTDASALRPRLRLLRRDRDGTGPATAALAAAAAAAAQQRARDEDAVAAELAGTVALYPEGFAWLPGGPLTSMALATVIQAVSGADYPPPGKAVAPLAAAPRAATLAGVRLLPAGRLGPGLLLAREAAAMAAPVPARRGAVWDRRFRVAGAAPWPEGAMLGPLGEDAARFRRNSRLPAAVLRTLPAVRQHGTLLAVPYLGYPEPAPGDRVAVVFTPARPAAAAPRAIGDA